MLTPSIFPINVAKIIFFPPQLSPTSSFLQLSPYYFSRTKKKMNLDADLHLILAEACSTTMLADRTGEFAVLLSQEGIASTTVFRSVVNSTLWPAIKLPIGLKAVLEAQFTTTAKRK